MLHSSVQSDADRGVMTYWAVYHGITLDSWLIIIIRDCWTYQISRSGWWARKPGMWSVLQFIPNVFSKVEVRVLCRPFNFFYTNLSRPGLYKINFVHRGMFMLEQSWIRPLSSGEGKTECYSIQKHSRQRCASNYRATVWGRLTYVQVRWSWVHLLLAIWKNIGHDLQFVLCSYGISNLT